jgi:uncharacterized protein (TIGR03083 family)
VTWLAHDRCEAEFATETARLAAAVSGLAPATRVPACPEWTVRDLVTHVGTGHRWAAGIVSGRLRTPPPYALVDPPQDPDAWSEWLITGARHLTQAIRDCGADAAVWTWRAEGTAGFWLRKMLHDELIHRFDAELASGGRGDVAADVAADGVSDLLATIATLSNTGGANPVMTGLAGTGETMQLRATDPGLAGADWLVERTPAGATWRSGQAPADVTVQARARELLLVLNRRLDPDEQGVQIAGDRALLTHWLAHSRF